MTPQEFLLSFYINQIKNRRGQTKRWIAEQLGDNSLKLIKEE